MAGDIAERRRWGLKHGRTLSFPLTNFVVVGRYRNRAQVKYFRGNPLRAGC